MTSQLGSACTLGNILNTEVPTFTMNPEATVAGVKEFIVYISDISRDGKTITVKPLTIFNKDFYSLEKIAEIFKKNAVMGIEEHSDGIYLRMHEARADEIGNEAVHIKVLFEDKSHEVGKAIGVYPYKTERYNSVYPVILKEYITVILPKIIKRTAEKLAIEKK